jgi:hypothetical protein
MPTLILKLSSYAMVIAGLATFGLMPLNTQAQEHSVAFEWSEVLLEGIRNDYARPTVHARNLFHTSTLMYDAWAAYEPGAKTLFLGDTLGGFIVPFDGVVAPGEIEAAQEEAISFAMYRLMEHRFANSPGAIYINFLTGNLMNNLGYDPDYTSEDYQNGPPAALGNYMAAKMIEFGFQDGANEVEDYANLYYVNVNLPLFMDNPGNPYLLDPNRWQELSITQFIDQGGNSLSSTPEFLGPEWGLVTPFSLKQEDLSIIERDEENWWVYHDPGQPPYLDITTQTGLEDPYKWGYAMVTVWSGHCDPTDGVTIDISPGAIGNNDIASYPQDFADFGQFYNFLEGGDVGTGYDVNPSTGLPYEPNIVKRGDYGRVLAEFWADGPDSETPPGHWFTLLNYVLDYPGFEKRWEGQGEILPDLEYDVKAYLSMGGTMHDCAISAWGIKGYYDYIRPVSAIRYMADLGQSTDENLPHYHPGGFPLIPDHVELVEVGDPLAGVDNENVDKIKIYSWKGPEYIENEIFDEAGVDWILAENWWPYQRPTFVTPPFAGFVSGHSTYSRAAAEIMTAMTGDAYFPGGMGVFDCEQDQFLVFEDGPSAFVELQWATYRDASDQCSLSRIWGGIHPPADDLPGREIGLEIGLDAFDFVTELFNTEVPRVESIDPAVTMINDAQDGLEFTLTVAFDQDMAAMQFPVITFPNADLSATLTMSDVTWMTPDTLIATYTVADANVTLMDVSVNVIGGYNTLGTPLEPAVVTEVFDVDTENPMVSASAPSMDMLADANVGDGMWTVELSYSEAMNVDMTPVIGFPMEDMSGSLVMNTDMSMWDETGMIFTAAFNVLDENIELSNGDISAVMATDANGNVQLDFESADVVSIDTKNPGLLLLSANTYTVVDEDAGTATLSMIAIFDEAMDTGAAPAFGFPIEDPTNTLTLNTDESGWLNGTTYSVAYDVTDLNEAIEDIDVEITGTTDLAGNAQVDILLINQLTIDMDSAVSVGEILRAENLTIYPNPVRSDASFTVETNHEVAGSLVRMYSITGEMVRNLQINQSGTQFVVSTANLAAGQYVIQLENDFGKVGFTVQVAE